jgi:hypothetical protein
MQKQTKAAESLLEITMSDMQDQSKGWFGIKTLYRTTAVGTPLHVDDDFDDALVLLEERIILCQAADIDEAIVEAEALAKAYAATVLYANKYGQTVATAYMGACDAYAIEGMLIHGVEVYSATQLIRGDVSNDEIIDKMLGPPIGPSERSRRKKFVRAEIARELA